MTQQELEELCAEWQARLRLLDWNVRLEICRYYGMPDSLGDCDCDIPTKAAKIRLLVQDDISPHEVYPDMEHTIVHELLHLHFAPFYDAENQYMEQAINLIAGALCDN